MKIISNKLKMIFRLFLSLGVFLVFVQSLSENKSFRVSSLELSDPKIYPKRSIFGIKSIQPDGWKLDDLVGNGAGAVVVNFPWASFQPAEKAAPCSINEILYDGFCFLPVLRSEMLNYFNRELMVTGVLIVPPYWARRKNIDCKQENQNFCAPDDSLAFGRFAAFLAWFFNGKNGNGRISEFVIMNEVNAAEWYNVGCGNGKFCDVDRWVDNYARLYNEAYDRIRHEQSQAPVLISFEHHFASDFDRLLNQSSPVVSVETFLKKLVPQLAQRQWALAFHSYPPNLLRSYFDRDDWPIISFGNVNRLVGWLMQKYPQVPSSHKVYLTENGINSLSPYSDEIQQRNQLCRAFEIILSTPNIDLFVYHRLKDHPVETKDGLGCGLVDVNNRYKSAWGLWALVNRFDLVGHQLSCGFEHVPYVILKRAYNSTKGHLTTSRPVPSGFIVERTWKLFREYRNNTRLLFECQRLSDKQNFVSTRIDCENQEAWGPIGYIYLDQSTDQQTVGVYRCRAGSDYFVSPDSKCENQTNEGLLGFALN